MSVPESSTDRLAYRVDEVVRLTGLSRALVYRLMADGRLRYVKVGKKVRLVPRDAVDALLSEGVK